MRLRSKVVAILLLVLLHFGADAAVAQVSNMSGKWILNLSKSNWGGKPAPQKVDLTIEHNEPRLKYKGTVVDANEVAKVFEFDGAIDGKQYPVKTDTGESKAVLKRLSPNTISSILTSADGKSEEATTTIVSRDGKSLIRKIRLKAPDGNRSWTEVYNRVE